jgi:hypothetical protein
MTYPWRRKAFVVFLLVVTMSVAGPFGTYLELTPVNRVMYWGGVFIGVGLCFELVAFLMLTHQGLARIPYYVRLCMAVAFASLPGALIVTGFESVFRAIDPSWAFFSTIWFFVAVIGLVMTLVEYGPLSRAWVEAVASRRLDRAASPPDTATSPPELDRGSVFLDRLRPETGRDLVSISVEDHYLNVRTRTGRETLLLRLKDAEMELEDWPGMRVHRSHWVSLDAVRALERSGHSWSVMLENGQVLPVSREIGPALRQRIDRRQAPHSKPRPARTE